MCARTTAEADMKQLLFGDMNDCDVDRSATVSYTLPGWGNAPSSSSKTWSNPTFCPRACFALEPQTIALYVVRTATSVN